MKYIKTILSKFFHIFRVFISFLKIKFIKKNFFISNLELGSGGKRKGWFTIDRVNDIDLYWDFRFQIPLKSESVKFVYSSHFLEHFEYQTMDFILNEKYRLLENGGKIRVCVPDIKWAIEKYNVRDNALEHQRHFPAFISETPADLLNYLFYMGGQHKFMFDEESLIFHLTRVGFKNVKASIFHPQIDIESRKYNSIYVEGEKWIP